jgi:hypothetical protein
MDALSEAITFGGITTSARRYKIGRPVCPSLRHRNAMISGESSLCQGSLAVETSPSIESDPRQPLVKRTASLRSALTRHTQSDLVDMMRRMFLSPASFYFKALCSIVPSPDLFCFWMPFSTIFRPKSLNCTIRCCPFSKFAVFSFSVLISPFSRGYPARTLGFLTANILRIRFSPLANALFVFVGIGSVIKSFSFEEIGLG